MGAFLAKGIKIIVNGDSNDYVGKGLSGGTIVVKPFADSKLVSNQNAIIGNTFYTGPLVENFLPQVKLAERFAARNSGGIAVVEGCGSNGCEYMTGGKVIILGGVSDNFGAGMTGGMAFIYDPLKKFEDYVNPQSVIWQNVETEYWKKEFKRLNSTVLR